MTGTETVPTFVKLVFYSYHQACRVFVGQTRSSCPSLMSVPACLVEKPTLVCSCGTYCNKALLFPSDFSAGRKQCKKCEAGKAAERTLAKRAKVAAQQSAGVAPAPASPSVIDLVVHPAHYLLAAAVAATSKTQAVLALTLLVQTAPECLEDRDMHTLLCSDCKVELRIQGWAEVCPPSQHVGQ